MPTSGQGDFSITINSEQLAKGLRPVSDLPRNSRMLTICEGMVGYNNVLQTLADLTDNLVNTSSLNCSFPYPQLFICTNLILVFTSTTVYELVGSSLVSKLTVTAGDPWALVDFFNYVYASNGIVSIIRDGLSTIWSVSSTLPIAHSICNFNGQVVIGYPKTI